MPVPTLNTLVTLLTTVFFFFFFVTEKTGIWVATVYTNIHFFVKIRLMFNDISFPQGTYLSSIRRYKCANH